VQAALGENALLIVARVEQLSEETDNRAVRIKAFWNPRVVVEAMTQAVENVK
jgi:hypothetical protein